VLIESRPWLHGAAMRDSDRTLRLGLDDDSREIRRSIGALLGIHH